MSPPRAGDPVLMSTTRDLVKLCWELNSIIPQSATKVWYKHSEDRLFGGIYMITLFETSYENSEDNE